MLRRIQPTDRQLQTLRQDKQVLQSKTKRLGLWNSLARMADDVGAGLTKTESYAHVTWERRIVGFKITLIGPGESDFLSSRIEFLYIMLVEHRAV